MSSTICFFNTTKTWGGGEKWHFEMAKEFSERGLPVLVIVSKNSELHKKLKTHNVKLETVSVKNFSYLNTAKLKLVSSFYKKHKVETVVMNSSEDMKLGGLAAKKANVKRIIYRRGSAIPIKNSFINRYFFRNVLTEILANSEATKKTINQKNATLFPKEKITVIPNGINIEKFNATNFEKLYQKTDNEFVIGNLGRMVYQKNQTFLIDVAKELKSRQLNFKMLIGGDGKLNNELHQKVANQNLKNEIVFTGFVENPKDFMMSLDVFLLPSHWEGFGYVLAEAMLCNKPAIAFEISSNSQIVKDAKNGFLVTYEDLKQFCDKIELLYNNAKTLAEFGDFGNKYVSENFDMKLIKEKVVSYLT